MTYKYFVLREKATGNLFGKKGVQNPSPEDMFSTKRAARSGFTWWQGLARNKDEAVVKAVRDGWEIVQYDITVAQSTEPVEPIKE